MSAGLFGGYFGPRSGKRGLIVDIQGLWAHLILVAALTVQKICGDNSKTLRYVLFGWKCEFKCRRVYPAVILAPEVAGNIIVPCINSGKRDLTGNIRGFWAQSTLQAKKA